MNDEEIYKNLYKILYNNEYKVKHITDILNIYFVFKNIRKGCFIDLQITKNRSNKLDILLDNLKLYYKKYYIGRRTKENKHKKFYLYCISNTIIKKELFRFFRKKNKEYGSIQQNLSSKEIGKFLGYECPGDDIGNKGNKVYRKKGYGFIINYKDSKCCLNSQIYSYMCKELDIKKVIKQLKLVNRMNGLLRKYLSKKLAGEIVLEIVLH